MEQNNIEEGSGTAIAVAIQNAPQYQGLIANEELTNLQAEIILKASAYNVIRDNIIAGIDDNGLIDLVRKAISVTDDVVKELVK